MSLLSEYVIGPLRDKFLDDANGYVMDGATTVAQINRFVADEIANNPQQA